MKKVVLQIVLIIILRESELIDMFLYLLKILLAFHNVIILIQAVVDMNKNKYYYDTFLEKVSYKDKSNTEYF